MVQHGTKRRLKLHAKTIPIHIKAMRHLESRLDKREIKLLGLWPEARGWGRKIG
jgi:hypothetical protein